MKFKHTKRIAALVLIATLAGGALVPVTNVEQVIASESEYSATYVDKLTKGSKATNENDFGKIAVEVTNVSGDTATIAVTLTSKQNNAYFYNITADFNGDEFMTEEKKEVTDVTAPLTFTMTTNIKSEYGYGTTGFNRLTVYAKPYVDNGEGGANSPSKNWFGVRIYFASKNIGKSSSIDVSAVTKNSATFTNSDKGYITYWKKGSSDKKEVKAGKNYKLTGLKASTEYQYYYQDIQEFTDSDSGKTFYAKCEKTKTESFITASGAAPKIASIKIKNAKVHKFGYRDILGRWHQTGTAAIGTVVVTFKSAPKDKYALINHNRGSQVKIKGKTATFKKIQFAKGSKIGSKAKVSIATASDENRSGMAIGISKWKNKSVRISK